MDASHAFSAFSPLNGGTPDTYYYDSEYPYDLDASLDYVRPATGRSIFPFPVTTGSVMGICPAYDELGRYMSSVNVVGSVLENMLDLSQANRSVVFPDLTGGLRKVKG